VDTGRAVVMCGVVVLEIADGQVTAERHYWPLANTLVQLGLIGSPPGPAVRERDVVGRPTILL
jgi:hypothetical protein